MTDGILEFASAPDHDQPADSNRDNQYEIDVEALDPSNRVGSLNVDVIVTGVNEPPELTGPEIVDNYREGGTSRVATYSASDPERATITWSLVGVDGDNFSIDGGALTFDDPPDYEAQSSHSVTVQATAGGDTASISLTVHIENVEESGT